MGAGAKPAFFTGGAAVPAPCLHIVGAQEIVPGQMNASSGLGTRACGWRRGCSGERGGCEHRSRGGSWSSRTGGGPACQKQGAGRGTVGSEAGPVVGRPGATPGRVIFSPGVDTWQAESPTSLCNAHGCFSGTKSEAWSLGENSASLTSRGKWQEVPTPACCPREPEKCPNASALGSSAAAGSSPLSPGSSRSVSNSHCPAQPCRGPKP